MVLTLWHDRDIDDVVLIWCEFFAPNPVWRRWYKIYDRQYDDLLYPR
jgi:hypothetical protein